MQLIGRGGITCILIYIGKAICNRVNIEYWLMRVIVGAFIVGGIGFTINVFVLGWTNEFKELTISILRRIRLKKGELSQNRQSDTKNRLI